ncbi:MAG: DinB family protein [Saprospiraceae bacterium]|nr:DinB family protein [Saprospiraceae bacterium]MCF8251627.1 DinB family protein [Saprospiraceae bacterium]MCF8281348.1 DinB family protein [Bacteroidales bacterium]MCF8312283.1 DinB family protein [Saprospiraceae bacterium]MCF8441991.1 DinB family protein [Saprospiraceae bacterium]
MKEIYLKYTQFNLWANRRMVETFAPLSTEQFEAPIVSSFPSVRLTFLHIWDAESLWLDRLKGNSPTTFPSKYFVGDNTEVLDNLLQVSGDFQSFVEMQPADFFEQALDFTTLSYGPQTQRAFEMIHHCMNHSTFHRGQLITLGRQLGIQHFPPTDYAFFLRE